MNNNQEKHSVSKSLSNYITLVFRIHKIINEVILTLFLKYIFFFKHSFYFFMVLLISYQKTMIIFERNADI